MQTGGALGRFTRTVHKYCITPIYDVNHATMYREIVNATLFKMGFHRADTQSPQDINSLPSNPTPFFSRAALAANAVAHLR